MKIIATITTVLLSLSFLAQEATIKYEMKFESDDPEAQSQIALMDNSSMTMFMKGKLFRQEINMGNGLVISTTVVNGETEEGVVLMGGMTGKIASTFNPSERKEDADEQEEEVDIEIEFTNETKEILGFTCKKAIIYDGEGNEMVYWYTEEIEQPENEGKYMNQKIPGMPLEFSITEPQVTMVFKAVEYDDKVKKSKEKFSTEIPEGYTEKSIEEIRQMGVGQ